MKNYLLLFMFVALTLYGCAKKPEPSMVIIPNTCQINAGDEFPISLEGSNIPTDSEIIWEVSKGEINPSTGVNVIYTAPHEAGSVSISVTLKTENVIYTKNLFCEITSEDASSTTNNSVPTETAQVTSETTQALSENNAYPIAITEVMAAPCNAPFGPSKNEYIELYNYGGDEVNVDGWWLATGDGGTGAPDKITTWDNVNPGVSLGNNVSTHSAVIPPGGFAVILSPLYYIDSGPSLMPYIFPKGTTILSIASSNYLGNDTTGLLGNSLPYTIVILYIGSESVMDTVVSTYGTPAFGASPKNVVDDGLDNLPFSIADCNSVERIQASGRDFVNNWRSIPNGNPGSGDYSP